MPENNEILENEEDLKPDNVQLKPVNPQDSVIFSKAKMAYQTGRTKSSTLKDKRIPQRVVTADFTNNDPITPDDIDDDTIIAPGKRVISKAYISNTELKSGVPKLHKPVAESTAGDDVLALQGADDRTGQTISFKVKGIQWKAGWSYDFTKTPLGHAIHPLELPPPSAETPEALQKIGIVIRTVNPRLQVVLSQLLPGTFRKDLAKARGKCEKLKQLAIFYLPSPHSASVGFIHEYSDIKNNKKFYLYIQTSVGKAPVAILDEVLKTLEAGLPEGEKADDFDYEEEDLPPPEPEFNFISEVEQSMKQASSALEDSIMVHAVKQGGFLVRNWLTDILRWIDKSFARFIRFLTAILVWFADSWFIRGIAAVLVFLGNIFVQLIWGINKFLLAIARSPIIKAILAFIGWIFEGISKVFGFIGGFFGLVAQFFVTLFELIGKLFTAPGEILTELPKIKLGVKELFEEKPKREKSKLVRTSAKPKSPPPTPQPIKPSTTAKPSIVNTPPQITSNLRRQTKAPPPPPKKKALGYFEDEKF